MIVNPFAKYFSFLEKHFYPRSIVELEKNWTDRKRTYHNIHHLKEILTNIERWKFSVSRDQFEQLIIAAFFHDAVYNPKDSKNHEDYSIEFFKKSVKNPDKFPIVASLIESTKSRKRPIDKLHRIFWNSDNVVFRGTWENFLKGELKIRKEFSHLPKGEYIDKRISFLQSSLGVFGSKGDSNIKRLIEYLKNKKDI
jgi:predicted metal-dependent HD superfamily phosphohydrolase